MKLKNTLLAVTDMEKSVAFYKDTLGLHKIADLGASVTLSGGLCLQTADTWAEFIEKTPGELGWCGNVSEIYFEEDRSLAAASMRLNLHKNTLQYRLNRIHRRCGYDPRAFRDAVVLYSALMLQK